MRVLPDKRTIYNDPSPLGFQQAAPAPAFVGRDQDVLDGEATAGVRGEEEVPHAILQSGKTEFKFKFNIFYDF